MSSMTLGVQSRRLVARNRQESGRAPVALEPQPTEACVLFIEDDERVLHSVGRLLESSGFGVDRVPNGELGLELARARRYDVILLDLLLPKVSGIDFLRQLRVEGVWTPVVILTGCGTFDSALEAGRLGAVAYILKPPLLSHLTTALRTAAEGARASRSKPTSLFSTSTDTASNSIVSLSLQLDGRASIDRDRLSRALVNAASAPELTFLEFMAITKGLQFILSRPTPLLSTAIPRIQEWIRGASERDSSAAQSQLGGVVSRLIAAGRNWPKVGERRIATDLGSDCDALWRTLAEEFGVTFIRCRQAVLMRRAALELSRDNDHVRQIAFRLGYTDAGNFDHAFRRFFGLAPTEFRRRQ